MEILLPHYYPEIRSQGIGFLILVLYLVLVFVFLWVVRKLGGEVGCDRAAVILGLVFLFLNFCNPIVRGRNEVLEFYWRGLACFMIAYLLFGPARRRFVPRFLTWPAFVVALFFCWRDAEVVWRYTFGGS